MNQRLKNIQERTDKVAYLVDGPLVSSVQGLLDDNKWLLQEVLRLRGTLALNNINPETGEAIE